MAGDHSQMRALICIALFCIALCGCARGPVADPGGDVPLVTSARPGWLWVAQCGDPLSGDSHGPGASYLIDPAGGAVARWGGAAPSPGPLAGGRFTGPRGEIAQKDDDVVLADHRLLDHALLLTAAWSPDGARAALVTTTLIGGAQPVDGATSLWLVSLDGNRRLLPLPPRPPPGLLARWLEMPREATALSAVTWLDGELVIFSNHESECWSGGQDIPGGCERALYRLSLDGKLKRISPRAFRCRSLEVMR
jgi:hypothetical protein